MSDFTHLLRPQSFDDIVGQEHLSAKNAPLRVLCEKNVLGHSFFFGPTGCGKTSLARIIAKQMDLPFYEFNATSIKIENLRKIFDQYKNTLQKPLIFIDEVHRLAKNQQEVLLPVMENNSVLVIGASTENPFFSLTSAIRSRSMLFELYNISNEALFKLLNLALEKSTLTCKEDAAEYLVRSSGGDARAMLKLLEFASNIDENITIELLKSLRPNALSAGSSEAGVHYDLTSAMIKSIRGSDMDAAIYYLARLIDGGESADFIARRLVILASEDIGNANPQALTLTTSAMTSVSKIGYPEARIILAQAVIYLCASPKSNSAYMAINEALNAVKGGVILNIPKNITQQNQGYMYPHDYGGYVKQKYLEKPLTFVKLKDIGYEKKIKDWLRNITDFS
ncbi:MAG: recombinase RarA [Sulfurimonas sp. RIFOXYD12_FULL_33_39]|uniref:replication-associated recombination protein A n=1 Tax=unclassified Sulfurimonas TaxID=2623549 RepID=UPI0008C7EF26|nr:MULTISPECIES: replication-associated recombination protein A [unclassified Sulfurimonas]OHE05147.1 MAG: recombinase RarA [Sulfurimonas sp. RIFCSPLOWO2_12_FULL_34_6]OHE10344.1 MAG: recombinase RarA [Sulfurimonas sp. RIFOXYD12_FULL_33_39]OHE13081.1 MAG: recombinase RarA [Sulfurimonas sp. RIFOXYD2_FULL_34_21]DAB28351.1 MAG TPA: recombinase RarA [Sulfurimonas sp. UBA10385]